MDSITGYSWVVGEIKGTASQVLAVATDIMKQEAWTTVSCEDLIAVRRQEVSRDQAGSNDASNPEAEGRDRSPGWRCLRLLVVAEDGADLLPVFRGLWLLLRSRVDWLEDEAT